MKKNVLIYFGIYLSFALLLIIPLLVNQNQVLWTNSSVTSESEKTKIELLCEDTVVGVIENYPGEKISYPESVEKNLSSYSSKQIDGWYTDADFTQKYDFSFQPNNDLALYARLESKPNQTKDYSSIIVWSLSIVSIAALGIMFIVINKKYKVK